MRAAIALYVSLRADTTCARLPLEPGLPGAAAVAASSRAMRASGASPRSRAVGTRVPLDGGNEVVEPRPVAFREPDLR